MKRRFASALLSIFVGVGIFASGSLFAAVTNAPIVPPKPVPAPVAVNEVIIPPAPPAPVVANPDMVCPVLPDEKAETKYSATFDGKIYYLCCTRCLSKFNADPKFYITEMEARANKGTLYASASKPEESASSIAAPASEKPSAPPAPVLSTEEKIIRFVGTFHPILLHFPIALLITAALAECWYGFTGRHSYAPISIFCVRLGALIAVGTALSGWAAAGNDAGTSATAWVLTWHRWLGTGTAVTAVGAALFSIGLTVESERSVYRWILYTVAAAVAVTGHFGGMLVYGVDYFKWPF